MDGAVGGIGGVSGVAAWEGVGAEWGGKWGGKWGGHLPLGGAAGVSPSGVLYHEAPGGTVRLRNRGAREL